ncbi:MULTISPECIES: antibiotic biosynthesis monooxygenase [unclassified Planococcus (in: firmicutes)]|uniref:antibiotic biosynthesis monooxygenase family protein n=1 Tax=unclassified Planococcus (in: firmicutes) TaxID=2662419 RepID=UPI000C332AF4|nr:MULTISPECIES: antibiotic biosynthesis monooxygenase [unclassified Planococcus (in: firmicutes)]AUD13436.1 antibiotic biosynthesis monooxygenase [Planococcus sp. MB-3u-03]PKG46155.1 antibiotic biosynthesis monooxygenase [Planococcus sp. Urea-trap-24]PKG89856.1 antibiotic biosynthesis monooxygenase [Planococcus sp. Urea-3u-39]PKH43942.1 antibiotic biosynthesis monooxygenase [Planococcus sp. MB-3u-09]
MNIYMTTGTYEFMKKMREKHADETMVLMQGENTTLLLHETEGKSIFQTPRRFEVVDGTGEFREKGFFVMNNIPVADEGRPVFEHRFKNRAGAIENEPGYVAFRVLRPLDSDTYVVLTEWESPAFYEKWKESQAFAKAHSEKPQEEAEKPRANIFSGSSYVTMYKAKPEEDE